MFFQPVVDGLDFLVIAETNPGAELGIEEEAHVFEAFLDEGVGPGGELDGFAAGSCKWIYRRVKGNATRQLLWGADCENRCNGVEYAILSQAERGLNE